MAETLTTITDRIRRLLTSGVAEPFTDNELQLYAGDAVASVETEYYDFANYTITAGSPGSISPEPDKVDSLLISLKAACIIVEALNQEAIGDAILIRTGGITLDTSRSLRARGVEADRFDRWYKQLMSSLMANGKSSSTNSIGYRIDNYIEVDSQIGNTDSESLIDYVSGVA